MVGGIRILSAGDKGAFFGVGDGEDHAQLHTAGFEFPDEIIETAVKMFVGLALM